MDPFLRLGPRIVKFAAQVTLARDAKLELSLIGNRGATMRQYMDNNGQLETGQAGILTPGAGETTAAIRRLLGAADEPLNKTLVVKRQGDVPCSSGRTPAPKRPPRASRAPNRGLSRLGRGVVTCTISPECAGRSVPRRCTQGIEAPRGAVRRSTRSDTH